MSECLLKMLEDGQEKPVAGPFMVCFDLSEGYAPVGQVFLARGGTYKFVKELRGEEALELHRTLTLGGSIN